MEELLELIDSRDLDSFISGWEKAEANLSDEEKQQFLAEIVAFHYDDRDFPFFQEVFEQVTANSLSLNFHTEHWAPTLLSLAVHVTSHNLFDYFLSKGADINFIGDPYAYEDEEYVRQELKLDDRGYTTCLDFAYHKRSEMMGKEFHYQLPDWSNIDAPWAEIEPSEEITVSKRYFAYILEQAQFLHDLVNLNRLIEHIKELGGKTYSELNS